MSEESRKNSGRKRMGSRRIVGMVMVALAVVLIVTAVVGYSLQRSRQTAENLAQLRTDAVLHAASEGLVDKIANDARDAKLKELRARKDFRSMGLNEVNGICDEASANARAEAEAMYSNPEVADRPALEAAVDGLESRLADSGSLRKAERAAYSQLYVSLVENVAEWTELTGKAGEDDEQLFGLLCGIVPGLNAPENQHMKAGFIRLARQKAEAEQKAKDRERLSLLTGEMNGSVADWSALDGLDDDALWAALTEEVPALQAGEAFRADLLKTAKANVKTVADGGTVAAADAAATEGTAPVSETVTDYAFFTPSAGLETKTAETESAFTALWGQLESIIPALGTLKSKMVNAIRSDIEKLLWPEDGSFSGLYSGYTGEVGTKAVSMGTRLAARAETFLIAGIALALLGLLLCFWEKLTSALGVPRTIITLFFLYLILAAELYNISVPLMMGNVLERMVMYGVLVLAMMPGIQCGIGLNMGMTIGCIAGLLGIVLSLQFDMTGAGGLAFACLSGMAIAVPFGWGYSLLLNRMKGNEMTISTYVGFSFVSLMCIGWMMLPFNNPKIIWLLSGKGLRVTHSLLGSYAHLLDKWMSFKVLGMNIPTGGLLFLCLCCFLTWLFSRSRLGIAMTAVGANPRFAEASGINVNKMRTLGTVLSTVLAALGIVIYSQSFGYAQLYTAPRQLGFIASSAILIGGATVRKAKVGHVLLGVFLFEGVLVFGQQIANAAVAGGGLSEVMRIMISNGIILYALTQSGGGKRE